MNDTEDETSDLSAPLLLRSESDEGIKDWFETCGHQSESDGREASDKIQHMEEKLLVLILSILTMLQCGFFVGSLLFPWIDTYMEFDFIGRSNLWNNYSLKNSVPLYRNLSLAQLLSLITEKLSRFYRVTMYGMTFILPVISITFNICFMSIYIWRLYSTNNKGFDHVGPLRRRIRVYHWLHRCNGYTILTGMELITKYQLVVFYMVIVYLVSTCTLQITTGKRSSVSSLSDEFLTVCRLIHAIRGGLISYILAFATGTLGLCFVRVLFVRMEVWDRKSNDLIIDETIKDRNVSIGYKSPPISAFKKIPWKVTDMHQNEDENITSSDGNSSTGLDFSNFSEKRSEGSYTFNPSDHGLNCTRTKRNIHDEGTICDNGKNQNSDLSPKGVLESSLFGLSDVLSFEVCVLAIILWVPILTLPIYHLRAQGILSYLMDLSHMKTTINIWDILALLVKRGGSTLFSMVSLLFIAYQIIICPVFLVAFFIVALYREEIIGNHPQTSKKLWTHYFYLCSSTIPLVIGAIIVINNMMSISEGLFNESYLCGELLRILNLANQESQQCLVLEATTGAGLWCLLAEGLCLEILFMIYIK